MTKNGSNTYTNSPGMKLAKIEAGELSLKFEGGTFPEALIGREPYHQNGDFDEQG